MNTEEKRNLVDRLTGIVSLKVRYQIANSTKLLDRIKELESDQIFVEQLLVYGNAK